MRTHGVLLLWVAAAFLSPTAGVPASSWTRIDPAPTTPHLRNCSEAEQRCLAAGRLPFALDSRCYEPLSQGPCAEDDFWFVLDRAVSAVSPVLTGACVRRPCAIGEVPHQGSCLKEVAARQTICAGDEVYLDAEGKPRCGERPTWQNVVESQVICALTETSTEPMIPITAVISVGHVPCSRSDAGECMLEVVTPAMPNQMYLDAEE